MAFEKKKEENYTLVTCGVEKLDTTNAPDLKAEFVLINKGGENCIIIDMSKTRYCDSSGLSALLVANRLCKNSNGSFVIAGVQPPVMKLIEISQLHNVLNLTPTVNEAVDYLFMDQVEKELGSED
jgi:anti-anti-sigma factor